MFYYVNFFVSLLLFYCASHILYCQYTVHALLPVFRIATNLEVPIAITAELESVIPDAPAKVIVPDDVPDDLIRT